MTDPKFFMILGSPKQIVNSFKSIPDYQKHATVITYGESAGFVHLASDQELIESSLDQNGFMVQQIHGPNGIIKRTKGVSLIFHGNKSRFRNFIE